MELVSVEELKRELALLMKRRGLKKRSDLAFDAEDIECLIDETMLTDAVEVVRCQDCKEYIPWLRGSICSRLGSYYGNTKPDDYCSKGVKKKEDMR